MADSKITALTALTAADPANDMFPVVDVSDTTMAASGTTKRISINNILACSPSATLASATITGDLTVDTSTLKVDSANDNVGIGTTTPASYAFNDPVKLAIANTGTAGAGNTFTIASGSTGFGQIAFANGTSGTSRYNGYIKYSHSTNAMEFYTTAGALQATLNSTGLGVGVTPSAWAAGYKVIQGQIGGFALSNDNSSNNQFRLSSNAYFDTVDNRWEYYGTSTATAYEQRVGEHRFYNAISGSANTLIPFVQAMTLTAGGELLVGTTSGTYHTIRKNVASDAGNAVFEIQGNGGTTSSIYYGVTGYNANAANAASKFGRDVTTLRSINAGGTVNASGADYAEYMTKASDFILSKGDVAGIDANGKLTNVFADAVSFAVKSTDPSYVGNDKWGVDLEGDALEAARQLVDRIAFAGQVPVNVTGAKAGDYIVPVVDGIGIKGIAVSNPTFEQYQLAVGKVIAIDADGRARIIVKVA